MFNLTLRHFRNQPLFEFIHFLFPISGFLSVCVYIFTNSVFSRHLCFGCQSPLGIFRVCFFQNKSIYNFLMESVLFRLLRPQHGRLLYPAEKIDLLKGLIIAICAYVLSHVDTSMMYHLIKSQSVIKLYLFYNMLEVNIIYNLSIFHTFKYNAKLKLGW